MLAMILVVIFLAITDFNKSEDAWHGTDERLSVGTQTTWILPLFINVGRRQSSSIVERPSLCKFTTQYFIVWMLHFGAPSYVL